MANVKVAIRLFVYKDIKYMGTIAKGEITLSTVNDAYTVSLSNPVCAIHADFDGSHPQLDNATTLVTVKRGDKPVKFEITDGSVSVNGVEHLQSTRIDDYQWRLTWRSVNTNALEGYGTIQLMTLDGFAYSTTIEWKYSILRESTMLDWIQDWEGGKTKIGSAYIMTPKMFIGKKDDYGQYVGQVDDIAAIPGLTGVYIGPDNLSAGIYGYKDSVEIFHLNEEGGKIGGWSIGSDMLSCGNLHLYSGGGVYACNDEGDTIWSLSENGYAEFAFGNVRFYADGSAEYKGEIVATGGNIGGWHIEPYILSNPSDTFLISGTHGELGICINGLEHNEADDTINILESVTTNGGIAMYYNSPNSFGLIGCTPTIDGTDTIFSLGSTNKIAGWNFDKDSIYRGVKQNTMKHNTADSGAITIGSNGLRGVSWFIDSDGNASFAKGNIKLNKDGSASFNGDITATGGSIGGWDIQNNQLVTPAGSTVIDGQAGAIGVCAGAFITTNNRISILSSVTRNGGVAMFYQSSGYHGIVGYKRNNVGAVSQTFAVGSTNKIAGWSFDEDSLFTGGASVTDYNGYAEDGCISIGPTGLFGSKWKLLSDGSGSLAGGNIFWNANGDMTINAEFSADQITSGTLSAARISSPFEERDIPKNEYGMSIYAKLVIQDVRNIMITSSVYGNYIFIPCDIKYSGQTVYLMYGLEGDPRVCSPIYILQDNVNCEFRHISDSNTVNITGLHSKVITMAGGVGIGMIAVPKWNKQTNCYDAVEWRLLNKRTFTDSELAVNDELWGEYHKQISAEL